MAFIALIFGILFFLLIKRQSFWRLRAHGAARREGMLLWDRGCAWGFWGCHRSWDSAKKKQSEVHPRAS